MPGPIYRLLSEDHRRLEGLLAQTVIHPDELDLEAYSKFRSGLLRHIGMEENVLIPETRRALGGNTLPIAERVRLDHGAIAALLVPPPSTAILVAIRAILSGHNLLEEAPGGLYETCEELTAGIENLMDRLRRFPYPRLRPHVSSPGVLDATRRALVRAGYDWDDLMIKG